MEEQNITEEPIKKSEMYAQRAADGKAFLDPKIEALKKKLAEKMEVLGQYTKAASDIVIGTVMSPIHAGIEKVTAEFEEKKKMVEERISTYREVNAGSKKQNEEVRTTRGEQYDQASDFAKTQSDRSESTILSGAAQMEGMASKARSFLGSIKARVDKQGKVFAARWNALKGDKAKAEELLADAGSIASKVMAATEKTNKAHQKKQQKKITSYNKVSARGENQEVAIENATQRANDRTDAFVDKHADASGRRTLVVQTLAKTGQVRTFSGNLRAQIVQRTFDLRAKANAVIGRDAKAQELSQRGGKRSREIMSEAGSRNTAAYGEFNDRMSTYDSVRDSIGKKVESLDEVEQAADAKTDKWQQNQKSKGFLTRVGMGVVKLSTRAVTDVTKLVAKGDMRITEVAARTAALRGDRAKAQEIANRGRSRTTERMASAETINKNMRAKADRAFSFKDRKKEQAVELGRKIGDSIETAAMTGVGAVVTAATAVRDGVENTVEAGKKNLRLAKTKTQTRYNEGKAKFFTMLKEGPGKLMRTIASSFDEYTQSQVTQAQEKAIAASQETKRIQEEDMSK